MKLKIRLLTAASLLLLLCTAFFSTKLKAKFVSLPACLKHIGPNGASDFFNVTASLFTAVKGIYVTAGLVTQGCTKIATLLTGTNCTNKVYYKPK